MRGAAIALTALLATIPGTALAQSSWYDHYEAGLASIRKGDWAAAAEQMSRAIAGNANENNRARTYGAIFINYHPYYYRGAANLNLGRYEQAIADLEKTTGPGPENLGSIESLINLAKSRLAAASQPVPVPQPPVPVPQPVVPAPVPQPVAPVIDPALRGRAQAAVQQARSRIQAAQERDAAGTQQYQRALQQFTDANTRLATAKSNDELNAVIALAENTVLIADSAMAPPPRPGTTATRPVVATAAVLADPGRRVRAALESYFRGDFDEASASFARLAQDMPTNGWIWAFLGASQYSLYAFETDEQYRTQALEAFRKARMYGKWGRDGLPSKYFSRRIRRAFNETAG
ncbi:MAG TPA: hypothetical protein VNA04_06960 [Thermoanaerobaculia bacterium]|nr:hypothetical protein [Thermoanaerobaculia bacterium]